MARPTISVRVAANSYRQIAHEQKVRLGQLVREEAELVRETIIAHMENDPKTGRIYERPGGGTHQASAPGEAPAVDTRNLADSIEVHAERFGDAVVATDVEYAPVLEFGGVDLAPRPVWAQSADEVHATFPKRMAEELRKP